MRLVLREQAEEAARLVFTQCLALPSAAEILIFGDETTLDTARLFSEVAVELGLEPVLVFFSTSLQVQLGNHIAHHLADMLADAAATLLCVTAAPQCFPFRDYVRQIARTPHGRVAHMPGIDLHTLLMARVDYDRLAADCEKLALALSKGEQIEIKTWDSAGQEHRLVAKLDPWSRLPVISDGIIQPGAWGNIPSGETYLAPPEGQAEGSIVIDGALPDYALATGEELTLYFEAGRLVDWQPEDSPAAQHLQDSQVAVARSIGDPNWANLAEIGLGVNPLITGLTGNSLLDEKKYGTLHIALGDNIDMGGEVESVIHCDLVCRSPQVSIDGKPILRGGEIVLEEGDWYDDHRQVSLPSHWRPELLIRCTAIEAKVDPGGRLQRLWDAGSGRICAVPVGDERTAKAAGSIYQAIRRKGHPLRIADLNGQFQQYSPQDMLNLTYLLSQYGLLSISNNRYPQ